MKKTKTSNYNNNNKNTVATQNETKRRRRLCASPSNNIIQGGSTKHSPRCTSMQVLPEEDEEDHYPGQHDSGQ